ncbi:MAG TPA: DUF2934 domain-containing protein [Candidatus Angelobacter sp.]
MAGKTSGPSQKEKASRKPSSKQGKAVSIGKENGPGKKGAPVSPLYPKMEEEIRHRAYELYEERGRQEGFHQEDWIRAEEEVRSRYQREKSA